MIDFILRALVLGFTAAGFAMLFRALPWPKWLLARKPLSCAVCMSGHGAWFAMGITHATGLYRWTEAPLTVITYFVVLAVAHWSYARAYPPEVSF